MLLNSLLMILVGISAGIGVSAGTFAFILIIRVIPRFVQKAQIENRIVFVENRIIQGVLFGTFLSVFALEKRYLFFIFGRLFLFVFGISAGIFAGCVAVALAEILDTFPIFFRRLKMDEHLCEGLLKVMAIGKVVGSLFYFCFGYGTIGL